jgi:hypothetical protein
VSSLFVLARNSPAVAVEPLEPVRSKRQRWKDAARRARDGAYGEQGAKDAAFDREMLEMPEIDGESPHVKRQRILLSL